MCVTCLWISYPDPQFLCCACVCRFCSIFCGLRFHAQSHSDNGHVHATAPCSAHALTQTHPTMYYIPLVNVRELEISSVNCLLLEAHVRMCHDFKIQDLLKLWHKTVWSFYSVLSHPYIVYWTCYCVLINRSTIVYWASLLSINPWSEAPLVIVVWM